VQKCKKCVLERSDRNYRQQPSVNISFGAICQKVKKFSFFQKIKKLQKVTFAFWHTCTAFLLDLGGQNRKSAKSCTFCTLALPNRPSRTFAYVYDVFARSGRSKITFCAFGAKSTWCYFFRRPRAPRANGPDPPLLGLTDGEGGGVFHIPPSRTLPLPPEVKNSTTAKYCCGAETGGMCEGLQLGSGAVHASHCGVCIVRLH
jgi:hypothetical protein